MDLFEFQARDLFDEYGVPVLRGIVARTPEQVQAAAEKIGVPVVVKAQVKTGGRGKAGGVKLARTVEEATEHARAILGMDINGHTVHQVMVAEGCDIKEEYYFSLVLDRTQRSYLAMCSVEGGVDIETLARERPDKLLRMSIDPAVGLDRDTAQEIVERAGFRLEDRARVARVLVQLGRVYRREDCTLVEVNPLVKDAHGDILALDGKVTLDDNAAFRHPAWKGLRDDTLTDPLEVKAVAKGLNYVKLNGNVGVIGNGAGLVMSTLDVVAKAGEDLPGHPHPANFLDIGGGASAQVMADGLEIILADEQVKSVFVNVFGGITACNEVANGIVHAMQMLGEKATKPLVVRLDGNAVEIGRAILEEFAHPLVTVVDTMDAAARKAAELAAQEA